MWKTEVFKERGGAIVIGLTELMQMFWEQGSVKQDFKDANIIYKNKGNTVTMLPAINTVVYHSRAQLERSYITY